MVAFLNDEVANHILLSISIISARRTTGRICNRGARKICAAWSDLEGVLLMLFMENIMIKTMFLMIII